MTRLKAAPRAGFRAHLVFQLVPFILGSYASAVTVSDCGSLPAIPNRYIVRTLVSDAPSNSLVEKLVLANPSKVIHRSTAGEIDVGSQKPTEKSTLTVVSSLGDEELRAVATDPSTLSIEQDCYVKVEEGTSGVAASYPNDPVPSVNQGVRDQLRLPQAWATRTDARPIIVAVSDTGVDLQHEDLAQNLWTNKAEANGTTGVDDDGNGCIDDIHGCDFGDYDGDPSPFTGGEGAHGTHVAGIIGAQGNNSIGSNGVAWRVQLLAAKGFDAGGMASTSDLLYSVYYSVNNGARVINCSWGAQRTPTQAEKDAFQYALDQGVLAVVAAGNAGVDAAGASPAALDSVLTVGSINSQDKVSAFSNFGTHVHVYAPGGDAGINKNEYIYSTMPGNKYGLMRGTSMAAPFVSGIAALVFSVNPKLSAVDVRNILISSSREASSVLPDGSTASVKIPDAAAALVMAASFVPTPYGVSSAPKTPTLQNPVGHPGAPEYVQSSKGCALSHKSHENDWLTLIVLISPLAFAARLRRRSAAA